MKLVLIVIGFLFCLSFMGCNGHCLTLDGTYKEWSGGFTWCIDQTQSQSSGLPVVQSEAGERAILLQEKDVLLIAEILAENEQQQTGLVKLSSVSNFAEFARFLKETRDKKSIPKQ